MKQTALLHRHALTGLLLTHALLLPCILAGTAHAASTAPLELRATITPAACQPTLSDSGYIDYGVMSAATLHPTRVTTLPEKSLGLTLKCDVAARFALRLIDNRSDTMVPGIITSGADGQLGDDHNFSLGSTSGQRIGGYTIRFVSGSYTGDHQPVQLLMSSDGVDWRTAPGGFGSRHQLVAWGPTNSNSVQAYTLVSGKLAVQAFVNPARLLATGKEIQLDGATTLELRYL